MGDDDGTSHIAAESKGDEDQGDIIAVSHGGQGIFSDKPAGHEGVGNVIELLEEDASEHGKAEGPEHFLRVAFGQVFIHDKIRSFLTFLVFYTISYYNTNKEILKIY